MIPRNVIIQKSKVPIGAVVSAIVKKVMEGIVGEVSTPFLHSSGCSFRLFTCFERLVSAFIRYSTFLVGLPSS